MPSIEASSSRRAMGAGARPADATMFGGMGVLADAFIQGCGSIAAVTAAAGGAVLVLRRVTHAIDAVAPPLVLLAAAAVGTAVVLVADLGTRTGAVAARLGLLCGMLALAVPPAATVAARVATGLVLAAVAAICLLPRVGARGGRLVRPPRQHDAGVAAVVAARPPRRRRRLPGSMRQRYERYELPTGGECVRGRLAITVPAGARTAAGHVGFCPAFAETPEAEVTTSYDGVEVTVAVAEVLPWGVRVECRLAEPAEEPLEIPVDLLARLAAADHP